MEGEFFFKMIVMMHDCFNLITASIQCNSSHTTNEKAGHEQGVSGALYDTDLT
jgi:hypothetical protein